MSAKLTSRADRPVAAEPVDAGPIGAAEPDMLPKYFFIKSCWIGVSAPVQPDLMN